MKRYFVYLLQCHDGSFYVGVTSNLDYRLGQHRFGYDQKAYTFSRRPLTLVHVSDFVHVDQAIHWEKQLKGWSRAKKKALIREDWERVRELSVAYCQRESSFDKLRMTDVDPSTSSG